MRKKRLSENKNQNMSNFLRLEVGGASSVADLR